MASGRAHRRGLGLSLSAAAPPAPPAQCHRGADPSVTRRSRAISPIVSPQRTAQLPAAAAARAVAARKACIRPVAHTGCSGNTPESTRRHQLSSTSSFWLSRQRVNLRSQGSSYADISVVLNHESIPTPTGRPVWQKSYVDRLLHTRYAKEMWDQDANAPREMASTE